MARPTALAIDVGHLNVTWHHDWWADNVSQRMPRTRAGKIHLYNNLFTSAGNSYCTNAGDGAHLLVEDNVYSGVKSPLQVATNGDMLARNNLFVNTSGTTTATRHRLRAPLHRHARRRVGRRSCRPRRRRAAMTARSARRYASALLASLLAACGAARRRASRRPRG